MTTAKKTAAKKTTAARRPRTGDKPAAVGFNFDTWTRDDAPPPFSIVIGGERYVSEDPMDIDFQELNAVLTDPIAQFRVLFPDHADEILKNKIPLGAILKFNDAIEAHFGLQDFIAAQSS